MEDGENGRQAAKERGQERATEGVSDPGQPAAENLSMAEWDSCMFGRDSGTAPRLLGLAEYPNETGAGPWRAARTLKDG